jgi:hypothetical protein
MDVVIDLVVEVVADVMEALMDWRGKRLARIRAKGNGGLAGITGRSRRARH